MRKEWKSTPFSAIPVQIIDGDRGKNYPKQVDFSGVGFCVFLNTGNVTESGFEFGKVQFIDDAKDAAMRKGKLIREDVVMTTRGTIGNVAYYNEAPDADQLGHGHISVQPKTALASFSLSLLPVSGFSRSS
jgi:hypothetical protein